MMCLWVRPAIGAAVLAVSAATQASPVSHCRADEFDYFSCQLRGSRKVVSLCGSALAEEQPAQTRSQAWLQYRYGELGRAELAYPAGRNGSLQGFVGEHVRPYADSVDTVWFKNDGATYGVEVRDGRRPFAGVWVTRGAQNIELACATPPRQLGPFLRLVATLVNAR